MRSARDTAGGSREPAGLAGLADGSLTGRRRAALELRVSSSSSLHALLAEQRRVRGALVDARVAAPAPLRARIATERAAREPRVSRAGLPALAGGLAAVAAALALAVVLALPGGGAGSPSVTAAAGLGGRAATLAAPRVDPAHPKLLDRRVQGVAFPEWAHMFGWRHTGARLDRLNGRSASTVYYAKGDKRIAYTILSGRAVPAPPTAGRATRGPVKLRTLAAGPRKVVTWTRRGHTCVLSGARVPHDVLLKLAAWRGAGAVRF